MAFVHLHAHDSFSCLDGAMSTKTMVTRVKDIGQTAIAQTNHGNMFGTLQFYNECKKQNIKPILGLEAYLAPQSRKIHEKIEGESPYYHITLLAMNRQGLKNLFKLSTLGYTEGFYYKPRIDNELLQKYNSNLICLSGCLSGRMSQFIHTSQKEDKDTKLQWRTTAVKEAHIMQKIFGDRFYIELQRLVPDQEYIVDVLTNISKETGIKCVATNDAHYALACDSKFQEQIVALGQNKTILDKKWHGEFTGLYLKTEEEMLHSFIDMPEVVHESGHIADRCNVELPEHYNYIFPRYSDDDEQTFIRLAHLGLKERNLDNKQEYIDRLEYEKQTIIDMGFPSYFLIVSDYCQWAKDHDIAVGPGRGSAAGSLIAYALKITNIDPIKYNLLFQRFLNKNRKSMPDIDCDFDMYRRGEVIDYLVSKYGVNNVAQMATFSEFKPRGALRDFARAQGKPYALGEQAAKLVPPDVRGRQPTWSQVKKEAPSLWEGDLRDITLAARKSEGLIKQDGVHAAGIVITPQELTEYVPLFVGRDKQMVTQWDMNDVESIGLVKMDLLGLTALTVISNTIKLIKKTTGETIDINNIPEDDSDTFNIINQGDTNGLFQLDLGGGIRDLCIKSKPQSIEDIAAISAIYRPGPLSSGVHISYVKRKNGTESVTYQIPQLEPILKTTYGLLIYQEQAMKIATELAGYTLEEADDLRKAIGKKIPEKMAQQEAKIIKGMTDNNIEQSDAIDIWESIKAFANYGFNMAHAVAYSVITYQTAWLKTHYPAEFYCALLSLHMNERDSLMTYLADCKTRDIQVLPPDINESEIDFTVTMGKTIRFGLAGIKGVGGKVSEDIIKARKDGYFKDFFDFYNRTKGSGVNKRTIDALAKVGAFDSLNINRQGVLIVVEQLIAYNKMLKSYESKMTTYEKRLEKYQEREYLRQEAIKENRKPKAALKEPTAPTPPELVQIPEVKELDMDEILLYEKEGLGLYVTSHPLYNYSKELVTYTDAHTASLIDHNHGETITILGIISSAKHFVTRAGKKMATIDLEDLNGHIHVTVFSKVYNNIGSILEEGNVILLTAKVEVSEDTRQLIALKAELLQPKTKNKKEEEELKIVIIKLGSLDETKLNKIADIVSKNQGNKEIQVTFLVGGSKYRLGETIGLTDIGIKELQSLTHS